MDTVETLVVIGAGAAGSELAIAARQQGWEGRIVLIGEEPQLPYHRPPLSKAYLAGASSADALQIRPAETYAKARIDLRLGTRVEAIDRAAGALSLADGSSLAYTKLALCLGGEARRLQTFDAEGRPPANLSYLRSQNDSDAIRARLVTGSRVVIIGGGYVGLEVAASARQLGAEVTLIELQSRVLARVTSSELSGFYENIHREQGVRVLTGVGEIGLHQRPDGSVAAVTAAGEDFEADLLVVGIGLIPHTGLAEAAGLKVAGGIVVDAFARTSDAHIFAAGDCTVMPSGLYGRTIRLESVPNALEQARTAAAAMCGKPRPYDPVPWFWSDQYDLKLQMVGLSQGYDECVVRGDKASRAFSAFYLRAGELLAADVVNKPADFMVARKLVAARARLAASDIADEGVALKTLLPG
ncbi:Putidaredoxin reductase (plasmid) [Variovorax sp. SRS16]|uniref:NAD(P)/FAD-dependent oxidoreductase n=1 Tax=Variovorax sp. SRS16 TaxID=282217 RepID=UPI0013178E50|nr:FAD-dependent oxidoreductase [Variovorax sp. SRS16]VTU45551.1 Putidaredoxin reductase [Variovorax sp. SRS16]